MMMDTISYNSTDRWLRRIAMMIFAWGPILTWYKISFPVGLGSALILFISVYAIVRNGFKINVFPEFFWILFAYISIIWCSSHDYQLWTLLPPGGWIFFIYFIGIIGGVLLFDIELCRKYMRWIVWISLPLFYVQLFFLFTTGSQQICFVPPLTNQLIYEGLSLTELASRHLSSDHPCSIFLEKSYMAYYYVVYLCLLMFGNKSKEKKNNKEILLICITLVLLRSGSGLVGLLVLAISKAFSILSEAGSVKRFVLLFCAIPVLFGSFYTFSNMEVGQEIMARQDELTTESTSGYSRVVRGYVIYDMLDPVEKAIGKADARSEYGITRTNGQEVFYINGVQTILIYLGYLGAALYFLFYASLFRQVGVQSKMCIITLLTMGLLESNYLNLYMILLTLIPCADFFYRKNQFV